MPYTEELHIRPIPQLSNVFFIRSYVPYGILASGEWGAGEGGGGNFGTGVRASILKPTPIIYLAFEKKQPIRFIYLISQKVDVFICWFLN